VIAIGGIAAAALLLPLVLESIPEGTSAQAPGGGGIARSRRDAAIKDLKDSVRDGFQNYIEITGDVNLAPGQPEKAGIAKRIKQLLSKSD
jgi:hypothetical protein